MKKISLEGRSLVTWKDYTKEEILYLLNLAIKLKQEKHKKITGQRFRGLSLAMIFEKRSTRTRCSFETSFGEEGGHPVFLSTQDIQLGGKESIQDTARVLGRMFDAIEFRGFKQEHLEALVKYSGKPVYNGLTDEFHPTQALADIMTLYEEFGRLKGLDLCYCGDGRNNVVKSLMIISAKTGINMTVISPEQLFPSEDFLEYCKKEGEKEGCSFTITSDMGKVKDADALYTDVWVSMGEESVKEERLSILKPFQINSAVMESTGKTSCIFLHCLPAVKGEEVTEEVFESPASRVWEQAENRKHTIKAIMLATLGVENKR